MRFLNRSAGRLSRGRRGPLAGLAVLLLGLLVTGGLYATFSPAQASEEMSEDEQIALGRELFLVGCSFCHGQNGEGVDTKSGHWGPPLVGVGAAAVDFQMETGRMPMAQPGAQNPPKSNTYTDEEIDAIAAYVASLGPGPAVPDQVNYDLETSLDAQGLTGEEREQAREDAIARGGQIFLTNCTACHNFAGSGGAMPRGGIALPLSNTEPKHIYEAMLTGPGQMDTFSNGNLSPDEKRDVIAYLVNLREQPDYGGFTLGALGPVSEGLFAWVVGVGGLVGAAVWIAAHTTRSSKKKGEAA